MVASKIKGAIALALLAVFARPAAAEETRLIITSMSPAGTNNAIFFQSIATRLTAASGGTLVVDSRDGTTLATFGNVYPRVLDDVVQIGWAILTLVEGTFPLTSVPVPPLVANSPPDASAALWRLYKSGALDTDFKDTIPIALVVHVPVQVHLAKAPKSFDDLNGLRIAVSSKVTADVATALNGSPLSMDPVDTYASIQRGLAGGTILSWSSFQPYKLGEVTTYHIEGPFGTTASMLFMSKKKYASLPPAAQKAIDTVGGEALSREFGAYLLGQANLQRGPIAASSAHTIKTLTDAEIKTLEPKLSPIVDTWEKAYPGRPQVMAKYRAIYAEVLAGH